MSVRVIAPVIPTALIQIREMAGYDSPEKIHPGREKETEKLRAWEAGKTKPTLNQAKQLAKKYRISHLLFYSKDLPDTFQTKLPPDFRRYKRRQPYSPNLRFAVREVFYRQEWLKDYLRDTEQQNFSPPQSVQISDNPRTLATKIRKWLGITMNTQQRCRKTEDAFDLWRSAIEKQGVTVFTNNTHRYYKINPGEYDGLAISDNLAPLILLNPGPNLKNSRSIFTLIHELAHLLLGEGALSLINFRSQNNINNTDARELQIESWCNKVAGEVLAPNEWLTQNWSATEPSRQQIETLADSIKVSRQMLAVQVKNNHLIGQQKLEQLLTEYEGQFHLSRQNKRSFGITRPAPATIKRCGSYFSRCVLDAYQKNSIAATDIYDLTDLKLKYLKEFAHKIDFPLHRWR